MLFFQVVTHNDAETLSVVGDEISTTVPHTHPNYAELVEYLQSTTEPDVEHVKGLIDLASKVSSEMSQVTDRVRFLNGSLYFDGDLIDNRLSRHILRMVKEDHPEWVGFVKFLENLAQNPSRASRQQLFNWIDVRGLTVTRDGHFIAYKGVQNTEDNRSITSGYGAVVNGVPQPRGTVPYPIGAVAEMPRAMVDPDPDRLCSVGLHVATWDYASGWGPRTLTVMVNPRDVVCVPNYDNSDKIRVCRLVAVNITDRHYHEYTSFPASVEDGFDGPLFEDEPEEEEQDEQAEAEYLSDQLAAADEEVDGLEQAGESVWDDDEDGEEDYVPVAAEPHHDEDHDTDKAAEPGEDYDTPTDTEEADQSAHNGVDPHWPTAKNVFELAEMHSIFRGLMMDPSLGHKAVADHLPGHTSETAVRRWRKAEGIEITKGSKN